MNHRRTFIVDCDDCALQSTTACSDCVVSFVLDRTEESGAIVFDLAQARAVRLLSEAGLVAPLRHQAVGVH